MPIRISNMQKITLPANGWRQIFKTQKYAAIGEYRYVCLAYGDPPLNKCPAASVNTS